MINKTAKNLSKPVEIIEATHPAVGEAFHEISSFSQINQALEKLGHAQIDWLGTDKKRKSQETPQESSNQTPVKKTKI